MTTSTLTTTEPEIVFDRAREASRSLAQVSISVIDTVLLEFADALEANSASIIAQNSHDLEKVAATDYRYDRLLLNTDRIKAIASEVRRVAELPSPVGEVLSQKEMPNGLSISRVAVPIGVVGIIYEARPNVTSDAAILCLKTLNACVLKGGTDAHLSSAAIVEVMRAVLEKNGLNPDVVSLLPPGRKSGELLLNARGMIDVVIPRGSQQLINYVRDNAAVPVIETGAGIVHTFLDESADVKQAAAIVANAKTRRISVCNALDCLIIHRARLDDLPAITQILSERNVEIRADEEAYDALAGKYPEGLLLRANGEDFGTEFLALRMAIKTVGTLDEALEHISYYGSKHSEAILSANAENIERFLQAVDAAAVYANTSTGFTDGAQFGLGAEIGISTQKLHARGPMGLDALTSYKWIVRGQGQIRS